jgi:hypothetical protein
MPVFGHEITLQVDLATTAIAVMAFLVSFWLGWRQSRLDVESLRQQRDTDIIPLEQFRAWRLLPRRDAAPVGLRRGG